MIVSVLSPRKSIFSNPADSATALSNWVQYISESFAVAIGTKFVMSSGVMITPQAWIPVLRTDPSSSRAVEIVRPSKFFCPAISLRAFALSTSSLPRSFSRNPLSSSENNLLKLISGMSFAKRSASIRGSSSTRAVSRNEDLAAIVP